MQPQNFRIDSDREFRFSYFPVIFVWEAPIETRILDRYSNTGAKVRVKCIYNVTVAGEDARGAVRYTAAAVQSAAYCRL